MTFVCLLSAFFIPESPRFLIANGQYKQAFKVYKSIAQINGHKFSELMFRLNKRDSAYKTVKNMVKDPNAWVNGDSQEIFENNRHDRSTFENLEDYDESAKAAKNREVNEFSDSEGGLERPINTS